MALKELVEKAKNGSRKAFMEIIEGIKTQMYRTALLQLHNEQDALDAVQETLVKAFSNINSLKQNQFFKTWLIRILLNECYNIRQYRSKIVPMEKESSEVDDTYPHSSINALDMKSMLLKLDSMYREIIDLRYNHDMKLNDISNLLDIPVGTVKSRISRAHEILRKQYLEKEVWT